MPNVADQLGGKGAALLGSLPSQVGRVGPHLTSSNTCAAIISSV